MNQAAQITPIQPGRAELPDQNTMAADKPRATPTSPVRSGLTIKLQIAAGVFVPMLALGLWLTSQGFFG